MTNDTHTLTLSEFLLARIAEDEDFAMAAGDGRGPRLVAECEAKRRIVEAWVASGGPTDDERERMAREHPNASQYAEPEWYIGQRFGLAEAVQNIAAVYADHPDCLDEWHP